MMESEIEWNSEYIFFSLFWEEDNPNARATELNYSEQDTTSK